MFQGRYIPDLYNLLIARVSCIGLCFLFLYFLFLFFYVRSFYFPSHLVRPPLFSLSPLPTINNSYSDPPFPLRFVRALEGTFILKRLQPFLPPSIASNRSAPTHARRFHQLVPFMFC